MRFLAILALGFVASFPGVAAERVDAGAGEPLPGQADVTYAALLKQLAPDLQQAADGTFQGHLARALRYASGGDPSAGAGAAITIDRITALPIRAEGEDRLLLLLDLGGEDDRVESFTALALANTDAAPKLIDVADVSYDSLTLFFDPPLLDLSPEDQAILIHNGHSNSNQAYNSTGMLFVRAGKITELGSVSAFSDWWCSFKDMQSTTFETAPEPGSPYASIRVTVLDEGTASDADCGDEERPAPFSRTVVATYRWDAAQQKFAADSDALERLAVENEDRY